MTDHTALRARLEEIVAGAFDAGHWSWPTPDEPTRALLRDRHVKGVGRLLDEAIAALAPPAEPSAARKDAERLLADCELGPNCNICRVLRALLDERTFHAV